MTDANGPIAPTAKQRLQATRQALMHELVPSTRNPNSATRTVVSPVSGALVETTVDVDDAHYSEAGRYAARPSGWFGLVKHSARAWWQFHPARAVTAIAEPVFVKYARKRPLKTVGIAAGVGALLVVTRPWRLVSIGGLLMAALKSSQMTSFAVSVMNSARSHRD